MFLNLLSDGFPKRLWQYKFRINVLSAKKGLQKALNWESEPCVPVLAPPFEFG